MVRRRTYPRFSGDGPRQDRPRFGQCLRRLYSAACPRISWIWESAQLRLTNGSENSNEIIMWLKRLVIGKRIPTVQLVSTPMLTLTGFGEGQTKETSDAFCDHRLSVGQAD